MDNQLVELLEQSGFTEKEAKVYLALFELGQGKVFEIAQKTELKRPIIYIILEGLIKRGYASRLPGNSNVNIFQASDPSAILNKLRLVAKDFSEMLPFIHSLQNKGDKKPKIHFYDTKEGILRIYEEMSVSKEAFFVSNYELLENVFPRITEKWHREFKRGYHKLHARHLIPETNFNLEVGKKFLEVNQEVKSWSALNDSKMDFTLFENKLAITLLDEKPFIFVVESKELVSSMRPFFELAWEKGRKVANYPIVS